VIERVLDLVVLLVLFFAGLVGAARGMVPQGYITAGAVAGTIGVAMLVALMLAPLRMAGALARWRDRLALESRVSRLVGAGAHFFEALGALQSPVRALQLLALSALAWVLEGSMYAAVAWSLHATVAPFGPWFAAATGTLATLLPSSPGYVGTFDYFAMLGLTAYGADRSVAAAFALLVHLVLWVPVTVVGGLMLLAGNRRAGGMAGSGVVASDTP
jgi:glycosyltransferase 2 family protein